MRKDLVVLRIDGVLLADKVMSRTEATQWATQIDAHVEIIAVGDDRLQKVMRLHGLSGWRFGPEPADVIHRAEIKRKMLAPQEAFNWNLRDVRKSRKIWRERDGDGDYPLTQSTEPVFSLKDLRELRATA